jgi:hypothetical protein
LSKNPSHAVCGYNHSIVKIIIGFVDDDGHWRRWRGCRLNHNADAHSDMRLVPDFSAQTSANNPRNQRHRQPDQSEIQINAVIRDDFIHELKHRV